MAADLPPVGARVRTIAGFGHVLWVKSINGVPHAFVEGFPGLSPSGWVTADEIAEVLDAD